MSKMADLAIRQCGTHRRRSEGEEPSIKTEVGAKMPHEYLWMDAVPVGNSAYYVRVEPRVFSGEAVSMIDNGDEAILDSGMTFIQGIDAPPNIFS